MRKFTCVALLLFIAAACKKTADPPEATASFERTINGTDFYSCDSSSATSAALSGAGNCAINNGYFSNIRILSTKQ